MNLLQIIQRLSNQMYKEISKFTKVALSGDGADEVFFGYEDAKKFNIIPSLEISR